MLVLGMVIGVMLSETAISSAAPAPRSALRALGQTETAVTERINEVRAENGTRTLHVSKQLSRAARQHALSMARLGYFGHSSADGSNATRRITRFYNVRGATSWHVGEVIAWTLGTASADDLISLWLESPEHRRDLLLRRWREVGVGIIQAEAASGVYGNRDVTIVVVDLGFRHR